MCLSCRCRAEYEKVEAERRRRKQEALAEQAPAAATEKDSDEEYSIADESKLEGTESGGLQAVQDSKTRTTVRNLRYVTHNIVRVAVGLTVVLCSIREDTAKYLMNLDENSAFYDPKTRSMRENPNVDKADALFTGENTTRFTGGAKDVLEMQLFAWDASERGNTIVRPSRSDSPWVRIH